MIESFWEQNRKSAVAKQFLGEIRSCTVKGNTFYFRDVNSTLAVSIISDEIVRVRLAPQGAFLADFSYALQPYDFKLASLDFQEDEIFYRISTSVVEVQIDKRNFRVTFLDKMGTVINEDSHGIHWEENLDYGGFYLYSSKKLQPDENFYGLGDKATDLNLIRKRYSFWSTDAYAFERNTDPLYRNIPFYMGLHQGISYGIFYDNTFKSHFDFGLENANDVSYWVEGGEMNYYYIHGPHMMDVVKRYSNLTGTHPMPPMWALGYHQCRWSYYPEDKIMDLAKQFRDRQIPCDALYLDIDYMDGYRCFTWHPKHFPNPKRMLDALHEQGFKTVVIIDPGIKADPDYPVWKSGHEEGLFCRRADDYYMEGPVWPGRCQFPDFTNPRAREWWGPLHQELMDLGVDGIWNDMNEPSVFGTGTFPNDVRHDYDGHKASHRKAHNVYGMQMVRATYEGLLKIQKNKRPFTITRSAYSGVQRYASAWTGDNIGTWDHLKLAGIQCQRMSMSGISFVGSDIGGFTGSPSAELFVRWIQMGVFAPLMRAHSAGDTPEREPWSFGPETEAICKKFIELRYRLLPYIYSAFWENHKFGFPILRPVIMIEQDIPTNTYRQDEFTFGDKILVCPVLEPGASGRIVYLPRGGWYHMFTNKYYAGSQEHYIEAPIDDMPVFVRAGAVVPEYPVMQHTHDIKLSELFLNIYYADYAVNSFMYEDHGENLAYQQDIYTEKKFLYQGDENGFSLSQKATGLYTPRYDTYSIRLIGLSFEKFSIKVDGKAIKYNRDESNGTIRFSVFKSFVSIDVAEAKDVPKKEAALKK
ncbi:MAG: glycoside hydrolase family 31 protein [Bacteroidota bacterium]